MTDVSRILEQIQAGEAQAAEKLLPLVYDELRKLAAAKLAHEKPGQTLQATSLVHEAYLRLVEAGSASKGVESLAYATGSSQFANRAHFFAAAAEAMRRILVDNARRKQTHKRGGAVSRERVDLDQLGVSATMDPLEVMAIHEALDRLAAKSPRRAEIVKLRYFVGCTVAEAAEILGIAPATAEEDWTYAKAWLRREWLRDENQNNPNK